MTTETFAEGIKEGKYKLVLLANRGMIEFDSERNGVVIIGNITPNEDRQSYIQFKPKKLNSLKTVKDIVDYCLSGLTSLDITIRFVSIFDMQGKEIERYIAKTKVFLKTLHAL